MPRISGTSRQSQATMLRMPDGMSERIKEAAVANNRSMNGEIVARLEASFSSEVQLAPLFAELLNQHIEQEVNSRLKAIAAKIGGAV